MDPLEQFFKNHKDDFDYLPEEDSRWADLSRRLDKPNNTSTSVLPRRYKGYWIAASAAAILLLIGYFNRPQPTAASDYSDLVSLIGLEKGQYFPDLTLQNPEGELIPLSTLNAQVVLVDFWASSCMVCNEVNCYYFKPLYDEFHNRGFEIYGVSMDSSAMHWKNAIQKDGLEWVQVSDLQGFDSPVMEEFEVKALPTNYLLDQNGRIIAKNIAVADLKGELDELFVVNR
jgi:peroxiredoxin